MVVLGASTTASALNCFAPPQQLTQDKQAAVSAAVAKIGPFKGPELDVKAQETTQDLMESFPTPVRFISNR
jgi:hypothetical protein